MVDIFGTIVGRKGYCLPRFGAAAFSRKHGEGFFRWVHLSCSHESHCEESLQGIIIMKIIARSHCKESLQGVIARSHCKESLQGVMRVIASCKEPSSWSQVQLQVQGVKCKLQAQGVKCKLQVHGVKCKLQVRGVKRKLQVQGVKCKLQVQGVKCN